MRFVFGFISILALLLVGLLVAPSFIDWGNDKTQGLEPLKTRTGYDVAINGDFKIAFLPAPHVLASGVRITNPPISVDPSSHRLFYLSENRHLAFVLSPSKKESACATL